MVKIDTERYSDGLHEEILPLAQKCWNESTIAKGETCAFYGERDFQIQPDTDAYRRISDSGNMVIVTLRDDDKLVGYVVGFAYGALHHRKILGGIADSIYIEPEFRSYAAVVIDRFEEELRKLGVEIIGWPVTPDGPVYQVLKARGYVGDDIVMEKRLPCASQPR